MLSPEAQKSDAHHKFSIMIIVSIRYAVAKILFFHFVHDILEALPKEEWKKKSFFFSAKSKILFSLIVWTAKRLLNMTFIWIA